MNGSVERASREIAGMNPKSRENTLKYFLEEAGIAFHDFQSRGMKALEHLPEEQRWNICDYLPRPAAHSTNPLVRYLMQKDACPQEYLEKIARDCLHFPLLASKIPLTDGLKERIRFYKDEIRGIEEPSRSSGNSRYLTDLSDI